MEGIPKTEIEWNETKKFEMIGSWLYLHIIFPKGIYSINLKVQVFKIA